MPSRLYLHRFEIDLLFVRVNVLVFDMLVKHLYSLIEPTLNACLHDNCWGIGRLHMFCIRRINRSLHVGHCTIESYDGFDLFPREHPDVFGIVLVDGISEELVLRPTLT